MSYAMFILEKQSKKGQLTLLGLLGLNYKTHQRRSQIPMSLYVSTKGFRPHISLDSSSLEPCNALSCTTLLNMPLNRDIFQAKKS